MKPIIEINKLSKKYNLGGVQPYLTLRDSLNDFNPFFKKAKSSKDDFWALKDVSLTVNPGEVVGLIGRNGAGKSTLLKILSRITYPTNGEVVLRGRVASLLEVGTGFSPELTGRENIFLNGAILGMTRKEISRKFDEIIAFAEVEKFLDTPVKHYSSGMYMRLAFAVAAHLEPDILLVDEVLAVGDAEFQQKCLGKMEEVTTKQGRTILFVSHNMRMIERLCNRCVLIDQGKVLQIGESRKIISEYLDKQKSTSGVTVYSSDPKKDAQIMKVSIIDRDGKSSSQIPISEEFSIETEIKVKREVKKVVLCYYFYSQGELLWLSTQGDRSGKLENFKPGKYIIRTNIPKFIFEAGNYTFDVNFQKPGIEFIDNKTLIGFEILDKNNPRSIIVQGVAHDKISIVIDYIVTKSAPINN